MRHAVAVIVGVIPWMGLAAEEWQPLDETRISQALSGRELRYDAARQVFHASGRTLYDNGQESWGYWRVQGNQYCSQWPPGDRWDCYGLEQSGDGLRLRFVGPDGDVTEGDYAN